MKIALPLVSLAVALAASAQQPPTISTKVNVVSVLATVHDRDGHVVKNLTKDDFSLLEDGVPQKIDYFAQESDLPLTIGLLVDTSRSQTHVLEAERTASYAFLDQVLREDKDQAFVASFDIHVDTLQGLTSSHSDLESALNRLRIPGEFGTLIFSAVKDTSENPMRQQQGRKALILLTDGVAFRDPDSIQTAIEFAQRANAIIFSIRFSDHVRFRGAVVTAVAMERKEQGKKGLERMAQETGGVAFEVTKNQSIEDIYEQIEDLLRNQYNIGYTPARAESDGKFHKLKLTAKDRHLTVHARDGYYAD
jgi:VWFA-related protein